MFSRIFAVVFFLLFALLAAASPAREIAARGQCNTGSIQCCNTLQSASSNQVAGLLGLLGIVVGDITGQVGLNCSPVDVIGLGSGATCNQEPVCCTNNQFNGLVNLGCSPLNIGL
ncbi:fungal hydrophobin-domain-containing protein [Hygrophoropsis aurantiaca]|uniref:Fungal hydrophobin-domain-containing protein n=1 Tax=Hygrophoropsis aurantiaca TaxID=72124 RepID=A0ACB8AJX3_9AGAM|nr:fungal hydrophobin-domain-containing protein [Hygrophoropsis aurantiaca]